MEGKEQCRGIGKRNRFVDFKRRDCGADDIFSESTKGLLGDSSDALAHPLLGTLATRIDDAERFHARAVGELGADHHVAAGDAFKVVEVQRDGLSFDANFTGAGNGDLNLVEA